MALVTSYTHPALVAFMEGAVEAVSTDLGLGATDALDNAARFVTRLLGLTDIAEATDMLKVETLATWRAWLAAYEAATLKINLKAGSSSLEEAAVFDQIAKRLAMAEAAAMRYPEAAAQIAGGSSATVTTISMAGSPYGPSCPW